MQLTLSLPGCSITYAPSLELSRWILKRKTIDLIVSSPILPDGSITRLQDVLAKLRRPPDLVVVGDSNLQNSKLFNDSNYKFKSVRQMGGERKNGARLEKAVKTLGADIRNDLNNPLQEIVAMVFVAQAGSQAANSTEKALDAIDKAAKNMAKVVKDLEGKIFDAVKPHALI